MTRHTLNVGLLELLAPLPFSLANVFQGLLKKNVKAAGGYLTSHKSCLMTPAFRDPTKHRLRRIYIPKMFLRSDELVV